MTVRIGFIGVGGIAKQHLKNLARMDDVEITALCDLDKERAESAAKEFGGKPYQDFRKMLDENKLDAVYVCVPPFAHGEPEEAVISAGLHLFVEKPVDLDLERAKRTNEKIERAKIITAVGYQDRYLDIIARLREFLEGRKVGMIMGYWMGGMPGVAWWRRKELSGGQAVEQTTHIFDMARYLFGEVKCVYAGGTTGLMTDVENYNIEDASAATLHFESGLVGVIFSACFLTVGRKSGIDIFCKDAYIEYKERKSIKIMTQGKEPEEREVGNDFLFETDRTFIEAIQKGDGSAIRSPYSDAVRSLELSIAANKSMETGQPVAIG